MSHAHQEGAPASTASPGPPRTCTNCQAPLTGPYCSACGQHDVDYLRSFWHFFEEVLENLFHFEGKFLVSVAWLMAKPGRLTAEFIAGRRQSQLSPLRFYIFATVLFFFGIHVLYHGHILPISRSDSDRVMRSMQTVIGSQGLTPPERSAVVAALEQAGEKKQTLTPEQIEKIVRDAVAAAKATTTASPRAAAEASIGSAPPPGWLRHRLALFGRKIATGELRVSDLADEVEHRIPTILFLGMPMLALILKIAFASSGRFYLEHLVFSLHLHTWFFVAVMVGTGYADLAGLGPTWLDATVHWLLTGWFLWYIVASFRTVYRQSWPLAALTAALTTGIYAVAVFVIAIVVILGTFLLLTLE